jgi:hypothetical protein
MRLCSCSLSALAESQAAAAEQVNEEWCGGRGRYKNSLINLVTVSPKPNPARMAHLLSFRSFCNYFSYCCCQAARMEQEHRAALVSTNNSHGNYTSESEFFVNFYSLKLEKYSTHFFSSFMQISLEHHAGTCIIILFTFTIHVNSNRTRWPSSCSRWRPNSSLLSRLLLFTWNIFL